MRDRYVDTQQGGARWVASVSIGSGAGSNLQRIVSSCDRGFDKDLVHLLSQYHPTGLPATEGGGAGGLDVIGVGRQFV